MFDEQDIFLSLGSPNATVVVTKTVYQAATVTATETTTILKTITATAAPKATSNASSLNLSIPHHPKVDTAFTAVFGFLCLVLIVGLILRKKSKKLKLFNIPLILGTFCIPFAR
jgi:carbohydrate-binding DOMON domain-containing protein